MPPTPEAGPRRSFLHRLFEPVDAASLAYFRIAFGLIMLVEVWRYFRANWIARYFIIPSFHFTYYGFEWVRPWPPVGMYLHFAALGVLAACIVLGFRYRLSATLFFLGFSYVFLLEQARYLNHFYLICLISFLMIFVPAHRAFSIDAWRNPTLRSDTVPTWALWLLRAQISIPYFYGGLAKLNPDWLRGEPIRSWMVAWTDRPLIGPIFEHDWAAYLFSYGGLLVDLSLAPLLLWRRTRLLGFALAIPFNLMNAFIFTIGVFPWFMMAALPLFLAPDWPRRLLRWAARLRKRESERAREREITSPTPAPPHDPGVSSEDRNLSLSRSLALSLSPSQRLTVALLALYLAYQLLAPLRHFLYPGEVSWTEEGHQFSWHMKLRSKSAAAWFVASDPTTGRSWQIDSRRYLTTWQRNEMEREPEMILQFAHLVADDFRRRGYERIEVRVVAMASLNGRPHQLLIDPNVNLAAEPRNLLPARWIVPLQE